MATYVLCQGGWAGGWQWQEVASLLRADGHVVYTPTFTGLGERVHLAHPDIDLHTHIKDVLMMLKYEDLQDVTLVGYSGSGPVISGVAEKAAERIGHLVYLDAFVLEDGQSMADQLDPAIVAGLKEAAQRYGDGWRLPHDPPDADRRTDQPLKPILTRLVIDNPAAAALPRTFLHCPHGAQHIGPLHAPIARAAARAHASVRWRYRELNTGHIPIWTAPRMLAELLLELHQTKEPL